MLLCCFLLPHVEVLGNDNSTQAINSNSSDLQAPGEAPHQFEPLVFFTKFEDSSLVIECSYWQSTTDFSKSQQTAQSVNLAIIEQFATEEIEFAYPTITIVNEETSRSDLHSDH